MGLGRRLYEWCRRPDRIRVPSFSNKMVALLVTILIINSVALSYTILNEGGSAQLQAIGASIVAFLESLPKDYEVYPCINASGHIEVRRPNVRWMRVPQGRNVINASELSEQDKFFMKVVHGHVKSFRWGFDVAGRVVKDVWGLTRIASDPNHVLVGDVLRREYLDEYPWLGMPYRPTITLKSFPFFKPNTEQFGKRFVSLSLWYVYDEDNNCFVPILYQRLDFILKNVTITREPWGGVWKVHVAPEMEILKSVTALGPFPFLDNMPAYKYEPLEDYLHKKYHTQY